MNRTPPTMGELRSIVDNSLAYVKSALAERSGFLPHVILGDPIIPTEEGPTDVFIGIEGKIMNNPRLKDAISRRIRRMIRDKGYMHAVFVADSWQLQLEPHEQGQFLALKDILGLGVKELHDITGLGTPREGVMVLLETFDHRDKAYFLQYHRDKDGKVEKIEELQEIPEMAGSRFAFYRGNPDLDSTKEEDDRLLSELEIKREEVKKE